MIQLLICLATQNKKVISVLVWTQLKCWLPFKISHIKSVIGTKQNHICQKLTFLAARDIRVNFWGCRKMVILLLFYEILKPNRYWHTYVIPCTVKTLLVSLAFLNTEINFLKLYTSRCIGMCIYIYIRSHYVYVIPIMPRYIRSH